MSELRGSLNKFFELKPELKIIFINIVLKIFLNETKKFKQQKRAHFWLATCQFLLENTVF